MVYSWMFMVWLLIWISSKAKARFQKPDREWYGTARKSKKGKKEREPAFSKKNGEPAFSIYVEAMGPKAVTVT